MMPSLSSFRFCLKVARGQEPPVAPEDLGEMADGVHEGNVEVARAILCNVVRTIQICRPLTKSFLGRDWFPRQFTIRTQIEVLMK